MTLIVGALIQRAVFQAGDRLTSVDGSAWDALANKQVIVVADDALIAAAYTGRAYLDGRPTDEAIAEAAAGRPVGPGIGSGAMTIGRAYAVANRIAQRLENELDRYPAGSPGIEVVLTGIRNGKRPRIEPLAWEIEKSPRQAVAIRRFEKTPFDWNKSFLVHAAGDVHMPDLDSLRARMRDVVDYNAKAASDVTQMMVDTIRYRAAVIPTVGHDVMVVRLWNKRNGILAEAEYIPTVRKQVTQGGMTFPEAYSPWCVCPQFVMGPALAKGGHSGDGGWTSGSMTFKVYTVPGPLPVYFGSHSRRPSP